MVQCFAPRKAPTHAARRERKSLASGKHGSGNVQQEDSDVLRKETTDTP
jgi:hypothetical protein